MKITESVFKKKRNWKNSTTGRFCLCNLCFFHIPLWFLHSQFQLVQLVSCFLLLFYGLFKFETNTWSFETWPSHSCDCWFLCRAASALSCNWISRLATFYFLSALLHCILILALLSSSTELTFNVPIFPAEILGPDGSLIQTYLTCFFFVSDWCHLSIPACVSEQHGLEILTFVCGSFLRCLVAIVRQYAAPKANHLLLKCLWQNLHGVRTTLDLHVSLCFSYLLRFADFPTLSFLFSLVHYCLSWCGLGLSFPRRCSWCTLVYCSHHLSNGLLWSVYG